MLLSRDEEWVLCRDLSYPKDVIAKALDNGLILFSAGTNVIRFVPPLVITKADVDECIAKLKKSF